MPSPNENHVRHQVRLPNGKEIEVVYLAEDAPGSTPAALAADIAAAGTAEELELHVCPGCGGELVYPLDWNEERPGAWRIALRCPDCEELREGVFGQAAVERLDDELDRATGALLSDFRRMAHANMAEEIEFFVRALDADVIVPSDF